MHVLQPEFKPVKYFSIDRVFRNESLDATHLAEFHQIEGLIADRGLSLGNLIAMLYEFFKKLGQYSVCYELFASTRYMSKAQYFHRRIHVLVYTISLVAVVVGIRRPRVPTVQ